MESTIDEQSLEIELVSLLENKPEGKILFYRISKKWHGFLYALHKEDRVLLLKMILEICRHDERVCDIINTQIFNLQLTISFFYLPSYRNKS
jgi:hypothetical protein